MDKDIWEYFNDLNEFLDKDKSSKDKRGKLQEELDRIEKEYNAAIEPVAPSVPELPDVPSYDRMEYDAPTDEQLAENAENSLSDYKNAGVENIESETAAAKKAKEEEKLAAAAAAEKRAQAVAASYDEATRSFENDALKRGLARSSIAANKSAGLAEGKADALTKAAADAEAETRGIESEIAALEVSRTKALDSFNIAYAAKLTEKIAALTDARDKKSAEVLKYNNSLLELERKAANDRAELESKLKKESQAQARPAVDPAEALSARNSSKYEAIRSYLAGMTRAEAAKAVRSDSVVRDSLTDYYYYKLYNEYCK